MRIIRFYAENFKKLRVVEITPAGNLVQITGKNGQGKTSVLDAIAAALLGGKMPAVPIRQGEKTAKIQLSLGEITVTRKFTEKESTLTIELASGARVQRPQEVLDKYIGDITLDPLAFARSDARKQFDMLRGAVKLDIDLDALAGKNKNDFERRTELNRQHKALLAQAEAITVAPDTPAEKIDVAALTDALEEAGQHNLSIEQAKQSRAAVVTEIHGLKSTASTTRQRATALRAEADQLDVQADATDAGAETIQKKYDALGPLPEPIDTKEARASIDQAGIINLRIERREEKKRFTDRAEAAKTEIEQLTANIEARDKTKIDAISATKLPVEGLTFGEGVVLYNSLPLEQASDAERLRISASIAMAGNPQIRILRIKEGSLLDSDGIELLRKMAEEADYQVWLEQLDESGKVGIVMSDGAVAGVAHLEGETVTVVAEGESRTDSPKDKLL